VYRLHSPGRLYDYQVVAGVAPMANVTAGRRGQGDRVGEGSCARLFPPNLVTSLSQGKDDVIGNHSITVNAF
jgi:hypothetical protein